MRDARSIVAMLGLLAGLFLVPGQAKGQAVAFQPTPGAILDGVSLSATPVVSADRRYVRLSLSPLFQSDKRLLEPSPVTRPSPEGATEAGSAVVGWAGSAVVDWAEPVAGFGA